MRRAAALAALLGAGFLTGHALADGLPLPPVPSITSVTSIVSVTSALPTVPTTPPLTSAPSPPTPTIQTATTALPLGTTSAPQTSGPSSLAGATGSTTATRGPSGPSAGPETSRAGGSASPSGASTTGGGDPSGQDVTRGQTSRTWISATGPKHRRTTVLRFVLPRRARLVFVVQQLSPVCRMVSRFAVAGHAGVNRVRFPRPASGLKLAAGTYRISGRTGRGRLAERVILVVFDHGPPTAGELQAARSANVCPAPTTLAQLGGTSTYAQVARPLSTPGRPATNGPALKSDSLPGGVLGSTAAQAARAVRPMLVALLAVAIVLLGIASLPQLAFVDRRANQLLARHRIEIAALGAAAFIAVVITFLLG
jgi:hypothetical protein